MNYYFVKKSIYISDFRLNAEARYDDVLQKFLNIPRKKP